MGEEGRVGRTEAVFDSAIAEEIITKLGVRDDEKVLNIGSGDGLLESRLRRQFVASLDFSYHMLKHSAVPYPVQADASQLPFRNDAFEKICAYSIIQYLSSADLGRLFDEIARCLKEDGKCLIGDIPFSSPSSLQLPSFVRRILRRLFHLPLFEYHNKNQMLKSITKYGFSGLIVPQNTDLPFHDVRQDLLLLKNRVHKT